MGFTITDAKAVLRASNITAKVKDLLQKYNDDYGTDIVLTKGISAFQTSVFGEYKDSLLNSPREVKFGNKALALENEFKKLKKQDEEALDRMLDDTHKQRHTPVQQQSSSSMAGRKPPPKKTPPPTDVDTPVTGSPSLRHRQRLGSSEMKYTYSDNGKLVRDETTPLARRTPNSVYNSDSQSDISDLDPTPVSPSNKMTKQKANKAMAATMARQEFLEFYDLLNANNDDASKAALGHVQGFGRAWFTPGNPMQLPLQRTDEFLTQIDDLRSRVRPQIDRIQGFSSGSASSSGSSSSSDSSSSSGSASSSGSSSSSDSSSSSNTAPPFNHTAKQPFGVINRLRAQQKAEAAEHKRLQAQMQTMLAQGQGKDKEADGTGDHAMPGDPDTGYPAGQMRSSNSALPGKTGVISRGDPTAGPATLTPFTGGDEIDPAGATLHAGDEATLRTRFMLDGDNDLMRTERQQVEGDVNFDMFSVVRDGFGLGELNSLHLQNEAWENQIRFQEPLFEPRAPVIGAEQGAYPSPLVWRDVQSKNVMQYGQRQYDQRLANAEAYIRSVRGGSNNILPDDLNSVRSSKGLKRKMPSPMMPIVDNHMYWRKEKNPEPRVFNHKKFRRLYDPLREPNHMKPRATGEIKTSMYNMATLHHLNPIYL